MRLTFYNLGFLKIVGPLITPKIFPGIMENQIAKKMENDMETEVMWVVLKIVGPLAIDHITAPNISGYLNGTLILGTTHIFMMRTP